MQKCVPVLSFAFSVLASALVAQVSPQQPPAGRGGPPIPPGPAPTHADLEYAPPEPATSNGHKLDLYIPNAAAGPLPVVMWTGGSAWMADTGKRTAPGIAAQLNPAGFAVAGVSI
ncbi:MAG TPA: hypothetical protein VFJ02_13205, partial [Vicinamibacterales bacterium]|nr:hypothetical protein [Vicinamibacterales bacterium]